MRRVLHPDAVFDGEKLLRGVGLVLEDGHVAELLSEPGGGAETLAGVITPGFVDLQVNGGGGVLFNTEPTTEGIAAITAAHRKLGTNAILPTVITDRAEVMARAAEAALARVDGALGVHFEGPHIAPARRGTHAAEHVRPFEAETLALVSRLRVDGIAVMVTLAPEVVALDDIAALARAGAVVSIGHSDATGEEAKSALTAGASAVTHLFNAMSPMASRAPGVTGTAINSTAYCGIICDGHHVADEMVGLALRARPAADLSFLVSDAMPTVGGPGSFELYGKKIRLSGGRLVNAEGNLAGAHLCMADALARLVQSVGLPLETALRMAVTVPARLIGRRDLARIEGRPDTDLVHLGPDLAVRDPIG